MQHLKPRLSGRMDDPCDLILPAVTALAGAWIIVAACWSARVVGLI